MDKIEIDNEKLFAIKLADNDKKVRDKALSKITNYIKARSTTESGKYLKNKKLKRLIYKTFECLN